MTTAVRDLVSAETTDPMQRKKLLRNAFGQFPTGVTIVTMRSKSGELRGFTANSFTSVSLEPPMLLVCPGRSADSFAAFADAEAFAVNILAQDQRDLSQRFASKGENKFDGVAWQPGSDGQPILTGATAWFECATAQWIDAGDHAILLGEINDFSAGDSLPLGFHQGSYFNLEKSIS